MHIDLTPKFTFGDAQGAFSALAQEFEAIVSGGDRLDTACLARATAILIGFGADYLPETPGKKALKAMANNEAADFLRKCATAKSPSAINWQRILQIVQMILQLLGPLFPMPTPAPA